MQETAMNFPTHALTQISANTSSDDTKAPDSQTVRVTASTHAANHPQTVQRASFEDYLADPVARWTTGPGFIHFCLRDPWIAGTILWGTAGYEQFEHVL